MNRPLELLCCVEESLRVLKALPVVELGRRRQGLKPLVERLRRTGERAMRRGPVARARLQQAIGRIDARLPGGPNCCRRALLEITLDRGAAAEPFRMGLRARGGQPSGHAWLGDHTGPECYDMTIEL